MNPWLRVYYTVYTMKQFSINTAKRTHFLDITGQVQQAVTEGGLAHGSAMVFVPHTTAAVTINENADPDVLRDMELGLDRIAPWNNGYRHAEGNSAAHIKTTLTGPSLLIPVENGRLCLGTWQSIYFCEYDGPRTRTFQVTLLKEAT